MKMREANSNFEARLKNIPLKLNNKEKEIFHFDSFDRNSHSISELMIAYRHQTSSHMTVRNF